MKKQGWQLLLAIGVALATAAAQGLAQETPAQPPLTASSPEGDGATQEGKSSFDKRVGSPYVQLDSWIYPALERLAALGYIHSQFSDMRPWPRLESAPIVQQPGHGLAIH